MKKRLISLILVIVLLLTGMPTLPARAASGTDMQIGEYVTMGQMTDGESGFSFPIVWQVIGRDGDKALLYCAQTLVQGEFDASDHCMQASGLTVYHYGSSSWRTSDVRKYLNSRVGHVRYDPDDMFDYSQYGTGLAASDALATVGLPSYEDFEGFLSGFSLPEQCLIQPSYHRVINARTDTAYHDSNYTSNDYRSDFSGAEEIYNAESPSYIDDDVFLLNGLEYYRYVVQQDLQRDFYNPFQGNARQSWPYWLSDSVKLDGAGIWIYYGLAHLIVDRNGGANYGHTGNLGVYPATDPMPVIRPACWIDLSYVKDLRGAGVYDDPYVMDIDQSVLKLAERRNLYEDHPDKWDITVLKEETIQNGTILDGAPGIVAAEGARVTVDGTDYLTDADGRITIPFSYSGVTIHLNGYCDRTLDCMQISRNQTVCLQKDDGKPKILAVWADGVDILYTPLKLELTEEKSTDLQAEIYWGKESPGAVKLTQKGRTMYLTDGRGEIRWPGSDTVDFDPVSPIYLHLMNVAGKDYRMYPLNFQVRTVTPDQLEWMKDFSLQLIGKESGLKLGADAGIFKDVELTFDLKIPVTATLEVEDGKFYAVGGITPHFHADALNGDLSWKEGMESIESMCKKSSKASKVFQEMEKTGQKVGKSDGKWSFDGEFKTLFYWEGYTTADGDGYIVTDQGAILGANLSVKTPSVPLVIGGLPGFANIKFFGEVSGKGSVDMSEPTKNVMPDFRLDNQLSATVTGNVGIEDVASLGVGAEGALKFKHEFNHGRQVYAKISLETQPFITGQIGWYGASVDLDLGPLNINKTFYEYEAGTKAATKRPALTEALSAGPERIEPLKSDYPLTAFGAASPGADPQIVCLGYDEYLICYLAGGSSPSDQRLYARYFDGESWSEPIAVENNGTPDLMPCLYNDNETAYIAWTDFDQACQGMDLEEMAPHSRIRAASFDRGARSFTVYDVSQTDGCLQERPMLGYLDGKAQLTWQTNDQANWLGDTGENRLMLAAWDEAGEFTAPAAVVTTAYPIRSKQIVGDKVFWCADLDADLTTVQDTEIFAGETRITDNDIPDLELMKANGWIYWQQDGEQVLMNGNSDDYTVESDALAPDGSRHSILSNGDGLRVLVYPETQEGGGTALMALYCRDGVWADNPIRLTEGGASILDYSVTLDKNDVLQLMVLTEEESGPALSRLEIEPRSDLSLDGVWYSGETYRDDSDLELAVDVTNLGSAGINWLKLEVLDPDGAVIASAVKGASLQPGQTRICYFDLPVEVARQDRQLRVRVSDQSGTDGSPENNEKDLTLHWEDLSLENIHWALREDGQAAILADVVSRGYGSYDSVQVSLRKDSPRGEAVQTQTLEGLDTLQLAPVAFHVPFETDACWYVTIDQDHEDSRMGNDSDFVVLQLSPGWTYDNAETYEFGDEKEELKKAVEEAEKIETELYRPEGAAALEEALANARTVLADEDATRTEINAAAEALRAAIAALERKPDTSELERVLAEAEKIDKSLYTSASVSRLETAIAAAKEVLADPQSAGQVASAIKALNAAVSDLERKADKTELEMAIKAADMYDPDEYTYDSYDALAAAYAEAVSVRDNENASWNDVEEALEALYDAIDKLERLEGTLDKDSLIFVIAEAEALDPGDYTAESAAALAEGIANAREALANAADQDEIDEAADALDEILAGLEKKPVEPPFRFDDVRDEGKFYFNPVYWAYYAEPQITNGLTAATFGPDAGCTRGQVVTFLWRAAGCPAPESTNNPFDDVKDGAFYYRAVLWAVEKGITNGMSATRFAPDATCTRGQIVTFLWRYAGQPAVIGDKHPFADVKAGSYYEKAVIWAAEAGVTAGTSATAFSPNNTCTRGQVVTFLYRQNADAERLAAFDADSYEIVLDNCTWEEARAAAEAKGGKLLTLESMDEYRFVLQRIAAEGDPQGFYYLGARRDLDGETYHWIDDTNQLTGEALNTESAWCAAQWQNGEPNLVWKDTQETAAVMFYSAGERRWCWYDGPADRTVSGRQYGYIIEYGA